VTFPCGENLEDVSRRAVKAIKALTKKVPGKQIAVVTHEVVIKAIVASILGVTNSIYHNFDISNASITSVMIMNGRYILTSLNDVAHLRLDSWPRSLLGDK